MPYVFPGSCPQEPCHGKPHGKYRTGAYIHVGGLLIYICCANELVKHFSGELITLSRTSDTIINPLDLLGHEFDEKKLALLDLFHVMLGGTSEIQKAVLDRALTNIYAAKGITSDEKTWKRRPPIMDNLLQELKSMSRYATKIESETYRSLINRIEMYVSGVFKFLNRQTKLNFDNRLYALTSETCLSR